jgi:probable HAF family extracellular repeat protein
MRIRIVALLLVFVFLLPAGCSDNLIVEPGAALFQHAPGHGKGGSGGGTAYEVVKLGTLGGSSGLAWAINNSGFAVGEARNAAGQTRAFVWTESDGMRDLLGSDYEPSNGARHINRAGKVAGLSFVSPAGDVGFVYDLATLQVTWLPALPDHTATQAIAINTDGIVVGRSARLLESGAADWRTVAWVPASDGSYGEPIDLKCPVMQLYAAINEQGDFVANQCQGMNSAPRLWIRGGDGYGNPVVLGTLGGSGQTSATGIDDRGKIAGWSVAPSGARRAVVWHPQDYSAPIDLGDANIVLAMNNRNGIVGERVKAKNRVAVLWTVDDAGNLISVQEFPASDGYADSTARGINDSGWIVGDLSSKKNGQIAVLWRP